jgi:hypothetical protein
MTGLILFLAFWLVFAVGYLLRSPALDQEKSQQCDLW